jgi:hypothetical protein
VQRNINIHATNNYKYKQLVVVMYSLAEGIAANYSGRDEEEVGKNYRPRPIRLTAVAEPDLPGEATRLRMT